MRVIVAAVLVATACGDDGGSTRRDGGPDNVADAAVDAKPPNTRRRGLVQAAHLNTNASLSAGFYETPDGAPGCTWTYDGDCSLAICLPDAGLVAVSAGVVTYTFDDQPVALTPTAEFRYQGQSPGPVSVGTTMMVSAAGATVPAFTAGPLNVPDKLQLLEPANMATFDRTQPLVFSWMPLSGPVYLNVSQESSTAPYPASHVRTIRCQVEGLPGTTSISASLLMQLSPGMTTASASALTDRTFDAGDYEVSVRILALEQPRQLTAQ